MIGSVSGRYDRYAGRIPDESEKNRMLSGVTAAEEEKKNGRVSPEECQTCKKRKYQDGSDEVNVSFKNAAHISPTAAASAVRAHESQHVKNAYAKAAEKNGEVISASVSIHTAVCPECGRTYVSGGTTQTAIRYAKESNPYQKRQKSLDALSHRGRNFNSTIS